MNLSDAQLLIDGSGAYFPKCKKWRLTVDTLEIHLEGIGKEWRTEQIAKRDALQAEFPELTIVLILDPSEF